MADQIGRFLINSDIVSTVSRTADLPIEANAAKQFLSVTTGEGSHALFIVVKDANRALFYQFSFSVGFNFTGNNWMEVVPLESTLGTNNGAAIDFKSDGLTGYLRLRRKYGSDSVSAHILVYNLGYDAIVTDLDINESEAAVAGSIVSTPQGSTIGGGGGVSDHNSLLNRGAYPHDAIDAHLNHPNPHSAHEYTARKGAANGYAPLDADIKVPYENIRTGHSSGAVIPGDSTEIERVSRKNSANGYAGLDANTKVPMGILPVGATSSSVMRGDGPGMERVENKDVPNGYAPLDSQRKLPSVNIPFGSQPGTVCRGDDPRLSGSSAVVENIDVTDQLGEEWYSVAHIKSSFIPGSLKVHVNGSRQKLNLQYEEDPANSRFKFINGIVMTDLDHVVVDLRSEV